MTDKAGKSEVAEDLKQGEGSGSSSEYTSDITESGELLQQAPSPLFGGVRTRWGWNPGSKSMQLDVRQRIQTRRDLELNYKGRLDTSTGVYQYTAKLCKNLHQNVPSIARVLALEQGMELEGEPGFDPNRLLPGGLKSLVLKDWTLSPGVQMSSNGGSNTAAHGSSSSNGSRLKYLVTLKKQPQVLFRQGVWDSWLGHKTHLLLDPKDQQVEVQGSLRLKLSRLNITDKQDLQVACGCDYTLGGASKRTVTPYLKMGENSWTVRLQQGQWSFLYET